MNAMNQQRTRPTSAPVNNSGPKKRQNPESPGQADEKNSGSRLKNTNKPTYPSQTNRIGIFATTLARKNRQGSNNEKANCTIRIRQ